MPETQPNILLVNVDQWRWDCLGCAGHPVVQTPHLDSLASEGVRFSRAYASVPSCIAARASLLTGLAPRRHGRVGYQDRVPWNYEVTLPSLLAAAGYHTQAVGKMHVFPERSLLGFHNVILHDGYLHAARRHHPDLTRVDDYLPWLRRQHGPTADYVDTGLGCNGYAVRPWVYDDMLHPMAWVTTQAIDFLRRRDPRRPFFLFTSYHRPHPPLDPPAAYLDVYRDRALPPPLQGDWAEFLPRQSHRGLDSPVPRDPQQVDQARRAYYAQVTFLDHQVNRLVHALHEHGALENTLILFCADHGDLLYDHGQVAKGLPYQGSAGIPFLLHSPAAMHLPRPRTIDAAVELRDVLPTLCDAAGVPVPESVDGRSLLPLCRGEPVAWREYVHGEHSYGPLSNHWLTDGRTKYVWYSQSGREQLFDLDQDPGELHDRSTEQPPAMEVWRRRLATELTGREEGYVENGQLVTGRPPRAALTCATAARP